MTKKGDPMAIVKLRDLKFSCEPGEFCDADDYADFMEDEEDKKFKE